MDTASEPGLGEVVLFGGLAGIAVYEYFAPPGHLISDAMDRLRARYPWLVYPAVAAFALHLTRLVPPRFDAVAAIGVVRVVRVTRPANAWPFF